MNDSDLWTFADVAAGRCTIADTGKPKPYQPPPEEPADDQIVLPDLSGASNQRIAEESARVLRLSAMKVFERLGAEDWLYDLARTHPKEFLKTLQRLLPQAVEATVEVRGNVIPEAITRLTVDDLIAMRQGVPASGNVIDVPFVEVKK